MTRAASVAAFVFLLAAVFSLTLDQAALLAGMSGATAWVLARAQR